MSHRKMCLPNNVRDKVNTEEYNRTLILRNHSHFFFMQQKIIYNSNNLPFKFLYTKESQTIRTLKNAAVGLSPESRPVVLCCSMSLNGNKIY